MGTLSGYGVWMVEALPAELVVEGAGSGRLMHWGVAGEQIGQPVDRGPAVSGASSTVLPGRQFREPGSNAEGLGRSPSRSRRTSGNRIVLRRQWAWASQ